MYGRLPHSQADVIALMKYKHMKFLSKWPIAGKILTDMKLMEWDDNPKTKSKRSYYKRYTNIPFLMTQEETKAFSVIWKQLHKMDIHFYTIHDGILCKRSDSLAVKEVMEIELRKVLRNEIEIKIK